MALPSCWRQDERKPNRRRWCIVRFSCGFRSLMSDLLGICLDTDRIRPSGFKATVENRTADDCLVSADRVFNQSAAAISGLGLPPHPTVRGDHSDVLIPLRGRPVAVLYYRIFTGRDDDTRLGAMALDGVIDEAAIIGSVGGELINWLIDHIEQRLDL
jgi:hypothetical protein